MKLIREELYKICNRKSVKVSFLIILASILLCFFTSGPLNERCRVGTDTPVYSGFAAIKMDRELAKEFEGVLTDEVVQAMAEKCFFLETMNGIATNGNFVNKFFTDNGLTNGVYKGNPDDYIPATQTVPLESVPMGSLTEEPVYFAYTKGWRVLNTLFSVAAILVCLFTIIAISPVFSEEYALNTVSVLLTSKYGKGKDIWAKVIASILFGMGAFSICTILMVLLCGGCYGFQGLNCFAGMLEGYWYLPTAWVGSVSYIKIWQFFLLYFIIVILAIIMVCTFTLFASAMCKQTYISITLGMVFFILPAAIWFFLAISGIGGYFGTVLRVIMYCSPLYSCMNGTIAPTITLYMMLIRGGIFLIVSIPSGIGAFFRFRNYQVL